MEKEKDFHTLRDEWREKQRKEEQERTGIYGYCSCCGAPNVRGKQEHDPECMWYEDGK